MAGSLVSDTVAIFVDLFGVAMPGVLAVVIGGYIVVLIVRLIGGAFRW